MTPDDVALGVVLCVCVIVALTILLLAFGHSHP